MLRLTFDKGSMVQAQYCRQSTCSGSPLTVYQCHYISSDYGYHTIMTLQRTEVEVIQQRLRCTTHEHIEVDSRKSSSLIATNEGLIDMISGPRATPARVRWKTSVVDIAHFVTGKRVWKISAGLSCCSWGVVELAYRHEPPFIPHGCIRSATSFSHYDGRYCLLSRSVDHGELKNESLGPSNPEVSSTIFEPNRFVLWRSLSIIMSTTTVQMTAHSIYYVVKESLESGCTLNKWTRKFKLSTCGQPIPSFRLHSWPWGGRLLD